MNSQITRLFSDLETIFIFGAIVERFAIIGPSISFFLAQSNNFKMLVAEEATAAARDMAAGTAVPTS